MMTWTVPKPRRSWKERISIPPALCIALFLNFPLPVSASPSSDSDDNSTEMSADERSQRLEMLRSRNPGPATPSSSSSSRGNYSAPYQARPAVSIPPFGTSKPIKAEKTPAAPVATKPRKAPKPPLQPTAHKTEAPAKQSKPIAMAKAKAPKLKAAKSAKPSNTTNLKQGKPNNPSPKRGVSKPRCGFCLVNGILYCGDQGVSIEKLINQHKAQISDKRKKHEKKKPRKSKDPQGSMIKSATHQTNTGCTRPSRGGKRSKCVGNQRR